MAKRYYVGRIPHTLLGDVFRSEVTPTEQTHGAQYAAVTGPFQTRRGAEFMARYGTMNPHCVCVADAERLAKRNAQPFLNYRRWQREQAREAV